MRLTLLIALFCSFVARSQTPVVVLSDATDLRASTEQLPRLRALGMQVRVITAPGAFFGTIDAGNAQALSALRSAGTVLSGPVDEQRAMNVPERQRIAIIYLNKLLAGDFDRAALRSEMDWSTHPEHALIREHNDTPAMNDDRAGGAEAPDWTCGEGYNSEYLFGTVCSSVFFVESNGTIDANTYTWPQSDINDVKAQMIDAWSIWSYTAGLYSRTVTAVMDWYEPAGGIPVQGYEPVTRSGAQDGLWIEAIMNNLGRSEAGAFAKCDGFNHDRRSDLGVDNAYCSFIAYNPPTQGAPNQFTDGRIGYAYLGGPYTQLLFKANGWTTSQINRVYGHESGHIFHAFDEYTSSGSNNCGRSFNGRQNLNFQSAPCNGGAPCVMINNAFSGSGATRRWDMCAHTPIHLGWTGLLSTPQAISPVNDVVLSSSPVTLRFDRMGAPNTTYGQVKIFDRSTQQLVQCTYTGTDDSLRVNLTNGQYRWVVSQGNGNEANGYAGVVAQSALFTLNAPLQAAFTVTTPNLCAGANTFFTQQATGAPTSWTWSFPGGTPSSYSGITPPMITYTAPGSYPVSLTVGDGQTTHTATESNAVTVTGGSVIPFNQNFNGGSCPPAGWTSYGGNGPGSVSWNSTSSGGCATGTAAGLDLYMYSGSSAAPQLGTPRIDLSGATRPYVKFRYSYAQRSVSPTETFTVYGNNCTYQIYQELFNASGAALATNGGGLVNGAPFLPSSCDQWRDVLLRADAFAGQVAQFWFRMISGGNGQNFCMEDVSIFNGITLRTRALLQGSYDSGTQLMTDALRTQGLIPLTEPFSSRGYMFKGEGGGEAVPSSVLAVAGSDAIVDWVVVEVRDPSVPATIITSRAALIQRDGDVVDLDGISPVRLGVPAGNYHVCLKHRNHLGIMTGSAVALSASMPLLDLSLPATACYGIDARKVVGTRAVLWSGDVTGDGSLRYTGANNDRDPILQRIGGVNVLNTVNGYWPEDVDLNGTVRYIGQGNDRDPILQNIGSTDPNITRLQQVP